MSGLYEGTTTAGANTTGANTALDVNAAVRVKQLDAREQSLTAREHALKELERQIKEQAISLKEREAEVEAAKSKTQRDLADLAKRQKQVAETESSIEARSRDLAQREIEASEGFASKNREALTELTKVLVGGKVGQIDDVLATCSARLDGPGFPVNGDSNFSSRHSRSFR